MMHFLGYWICWIGFRLFYRIRIEGRENILAAKDRGGLLLAANHTSYFDPPLVGTSYGRKIFYLARKTLFEGTFSWLLPKLNAIPVDQERPDFTSLKRIVKELRSGEQVLIFPEGERSMEGGILPGQPGVGLVIAKAGVPVLPVRVTGAYEAFPRGQKWPSPFRRITVRFGEIIEFSEEELAAKGRDGYQNLADRVMDAIGAIPEPG